jgi:hypothetical protein
MNKEWPWANSTAGRIFQNRLCNVCARIPGPTGETRSYRSSRIVVLKCVWLRACFSLYYLNFDSFEMLKRYIGGTLDIEI